MGVRERAVIADSPIHLGGDPKRPGPVVPRGFLPVLDGRKGIGAGAEEATGTAEIGPDRSGRLELAHWLTGETNPLAARVIVNRVWHHLFGRGLVRTVDDFTPTGEAPSHPELLDTLAVDFMDHNWSIKRLIRGIVLSRVYRLGTDHSSANFDIDPENQYLWRMNPRRLHVEAIRDTILAVSGSLRLSGPESSLIDSSGGEILKAEGWNSQFTSGYRTVYLPVFRRALPDMFQQFDFAPPAEVRGARDVTTVPTQALFLMNSPFVIEHARRAAQQLVEEETGQEERARRVFLATVSRQPSEVELKRTAEYVSDLVEDGWTELDAWADVYHAQFSSAEFLYRN